MIPITDEAYKLLHQGSLALAKVEANGIRIDLDYLNKTIEKTTNKIVLLSEEIKKNKVYKVWQNTYGPKLNLDSHDQLGEVLFGVMKYKCPERTKKGKPKTDEETLKKTGLPFVKKHLKVKKLKKALNTYLKGILKENVNGFIHPIYNLHLVATYRSSADHPNFHNIPIRNPEVAKLIRRAFIARKNHHIVEIDFKGAEICNATCYHKDPRMIKYILTDPGKLHKDMAAQCYKLKNNQVTGPVRYCGKNMFVFPQFYGDWYLSCAESLWDALTKMDLRTVKGMSVKKHLRRKGITKLGACNPNLLPRRGTFEYHIKTIQEDFWGNRFKVYNQWKKDWYEAYLGCGYFDTLTGFRIEGFLGRNKVINYPVQGSAFHWLLWSLIRLQKLMKKHKMRSLLIGQIHDSIVGDIYKEELNDYLELVKQVIYVDIRKHWDWIIVPLRVEAKIAHLNKSWYDMQEVKI